MEYILSSLEMFAGVSENLINYTFNASIARISLICVPFSNYDSIAAPMIRWLPMR